VVHDLGLRFDSSGFASTIPPSEALVENGILKFKGLPSALDERPPFRGCAAPPSPASRLAFGVSAQYGFEFGFVG
jgi:hypothetical protein